jgi:hypothetical protein
MFGWVERMWVGRMFGWVERMRVERMMVGRMRVERMRVGCIGVMGRIIEQGFIQRVWRLRVILVGSQFV